MGSKAVDSFERSKHRLEKGIADAQQREAKRGDELAPECKLMELILQVIPVAVTDDLQNEHGKQRA
jgi:hypothetical protein